MAQRCICDKAWKRIFIVILRHCRRSNTGRKSIGWWFGRSLRQPSFSFQLSFLYLANSCCTCIYAPLPVPRKWGTVLFFPLFSSSFRLVGWVPSSWVSCWMLVTCMDEFTVGVPCSVDFACTFIKKWGGLKDQHFPPAFSMPPFSPH